MQPLRSTRKSDVSAPKQYKPHSDMPHRRGSIVSFTASSSLVNALNAYCTAKNIGRSELVRGLVAKMLEQHPEFFEILNQEEN